MCTDIEETQTKQDQIIGRTDGMAAVLEGSACNYAY